jgi:hypothetical protein
MYNLENSIVSHHFFALLQVGGISSGAKICLKAVMSQI